MVRFLKWLFDIFETVDIHYCFVFCKIVIILGTPHDKIIRVGPTIEKLDLEMKR
jgi:hypothetical protein